MQPVHPPFASVIAPAMRLHTPLDTRISGRNVLAARQCTAGRGIYRDLRRMHPGGSVVPCGEWLSPLPPVVSAERHVGRRPAASRRPGIEHARQRRNRAPVRRERLRRPAFGSHGRRQCAAHYPTTGPGAATPRPCSSRPSSRPRASPAPSTRPRDGPTTGPPGDAGATTGTPGARNRERTSGCDPCARTGSEL